MPDIFLSYSRKDQETARWFADAFAAAGLEVWWDVGLKTGEAYDAVTETALRTAGAVVVLWSRTSVASRWVRAEATLADRNQTLMPAMIEPCERPIMFELTHTADLTLWRGERDHPAWRAFLDDVRERLRDRAPSPPSQAPPSQRVGDSPCLAVTPFANRSGLAEDKAFAFGMAEDIIEAMARGVDVRVVSSSAAARFRKDGFADLEAMARVLHVRYVLEGNVRRTGQDLRVTTQLVETGGGAVVWSGRFDRPVSQLADLQETLVMEVAAHLSAQTHRLEIERALRKPGDLTAYEALMRAVAAIRRITPEALMQGLQEARRAVQIAPDYAMAIALVAQIEGMIYSVMIPDDPVEAGRIRADAQRAVTLEPGNSLVLGIAAGALHNVGFPEEACVVAERAVRLNPRNEYAQLTHGIILSLLDRCDEAEAAFAREAEIATAGHRHAWQSLLWRGFVAIRRGDWTGALETFDQMLALAPDSAAGHVCRAVCLFRQGRSEEALGALRLGRECEPHTPSTMWDMRFSRAFRGNPVAAEFIAHLHDLAAAAEAKAKAEA